MFRTRITEMFGIEYPIILGAMHGVSRAELVAAVSNAGGLGLMTSGNFPAEKELREEIRRTRDLTTKPFGANITLSLSGAATQEQRWRNQAATKERIRIAIEECIRIFEIAGGSPEPYMNLFKNANAKVMDKVGRIQDAKIAESLGIDAITIMGIEGGGHPGVDKVTSFVFIPSVVDSVKIPVIAAGGIGDARGFVAALALGAEGVLMGTRFMASQECTLSSEAKERLIEAQENETILVEHGVKIPHRLLPMKKGGAGPFLVCGQVVGLIHDVPTVKEIIDLMVSEATIIAQRTTF